MAQAQPALPQPQLIVNHFRGIADQFALLENLPAVNNARVLQDIVRTLGAIQTGMVALERRMDARFDAMERRTDARFDAMENRMQAMENRMQATEIRVDARFEALDNTLKGVETRMENRMDAQYVPIRFFSNAMSSNLINNTETTTHCRDCPTRMRGLYRIHLILSKPRRMWFPMDFRERRRRSPASNVRETPHFSMTRMTILMNMKVAQMDDLLAAYSLSRGGNMAAKRKRLQKFIGAINIRTNV